MHPVGVIRLVGRRPQPHLIIQRFGDPLRRKGGLSLPIKFPVEAGGGADHHPQRPAEQAAVDQLLDGLHRGAEAVKIVLEAEPGVDAEDAPAALYAAITFRPSPMVRVIGFSHQISLPASAASTDITPCQWGGVAMCTMSISSRASTSRKS